MTITDKLAAAIRAEPTELIHKWRVLEMIREVADSQRKQAEAAPTIQELAAGAHYPQVSAYAAAPAPVEQAISIQEAWEAAGGNPGIKATKDELLAALKTLDKVCDEADAAPVEQAEPGSVRIPCSADEASAMVNIGVAWLSEYAPGRLKPAPAQPAAGVVGRTEPKDADQRAAAQYYADNPSMALLALNRQLAQPAAGGVPLGLPIEQEPKYTVNGTHIVNRASGEPIPHDEPVFIFRARDKYACSMIGEYLQFCEPGSPHAAAVEARFLQFGDWADANPERMKTPDTAPQAGGERS